MSKILDQHSPVDILKCFGVGQIVVRQFDQLWQNVRMCLCYMELIPLSDDNFAVEAAIRVAVLDFELQLFGHSVVPLRRLGNSGRLSIPLDGNCAGLRLASVGSKQLVYLLANYFVVLAPDNKRSRLKYSADARC